MTHVHSLEVVNLYYCREDRKLFVKVPAPVETEKGPIWGFKLMEISGVVLDV